MGDTGRDDARRRHEAAQRGRDADAYRQQGARPKSWGGAEPPQRIPRRPSRKGDGIIKRLFTHKKRRS
jgi:hypothetical protein